MLSLVVQALQSWKNAKAVAALAIVALAVGIGCATAIYTVVNAVMLKPLAYEHGERYAALFGGAISDPAGRTSVSFADVIEYRQRTSAFDVFGWYAPATFNMTSPGQPQHIEGTAVTTSLVHNLGVQPAVGQWFRDNNEAVISSALWRRLGEDRGILGKPIVLNGRSYTITGVMPPRFRLPEVGPGGDGVVRDDVWVALDQSGKGTPRFCCFPVARTKPGVTFAQAEADLKRAAAEIAAKDRTGHPDYTAYLDPLNALTVKSIRPTLVLLMLAAAALLLITCANVAGLLLARSVERARETAIRVALGAPSRQLALHYFIESLVVSVAGAAAGVLLSIALVRIVVANAAGFIPRSEEVAIDWRVLGFVLGAAFATSALSSLAPLWQAVRIMPNEVLTGGTRASAGARSRLLSRSLVVAEIALAFTLLAVGAVMLTHLQSLTRIWPGFETNNLLTFQVTLSDAIAAKGETRVPHQVRLVRVLEAIPGVTGVAFANSTTLAGCCFTTAIFPEGRAPNLRESQKLRFLPISPSYFETMRIPLRKGRLLDYHDADKKVIQVVINQASVRRYWPGQEALGAYGRIGSPDGGQFQVVGIVGDVRNDGLNKPTVPEIYMLHTVADVNPMHFVVRSRLPAETLVGEVRGAIGRVDPMQPIHSVATMNGVARNSVTLERLAAFMVGFFALAALLMATLGIYGVVAYSVRQRTVEIGTRMALGAVGRDVLLLVVGGGVRMATYGVLAGGVAVTGAVWLLQRAFEIQELGWIPFAASTAIVAGIAMAASFFPAWRATLLSPMVAIRNETGSAWRSLREAISRALPSSEETLIASETAMVTEFVEAARNAGSAREALQASLAKLCAQFDVKSALLFERTGETGYHCVDASCSLPANSLLVNRLRWYSTPLPLSEADFDSWLRWAEEHKPQHVAEIQTLKQTGARIAVALRTRQEILGVLLLVGRAEFSTMEKQVLRRAADQLALMLENARLTGRMVEQEGIRRDLALATEVQRRLLPDHPPHADFATLSAVSLPARSVGGDYYDFLDAGDRRIGIALADVAGKGVAAALIMSVVQASLRILAAEGNLSLPQIATKMNRFLHRTTGTNSYATFFYAQIDEHGRQLTYVNAGHNPPYLLNESGIQELTTGGTVLGLFPQMSYQEGTVALHPGDLLVAFTDGVPEALNPGGEEFGEERLKDLLRKVVDLPVADITSRISAELRNWVQDADQYDDLTFIVMKVN